MATTIYQSIEMLSKEKGIDPQIVLDAVKDAMLVAARKHYHTEEDMVAEFNETTGAIQIYSVWKVVETVEDAIREMTLDQARRVDPSAELESEVRIPKNTDSLGRISAQTAKQVILQKVREAERETVYVEYSGRVGELVNCSVKRIEGPDLIVDIGKTEARLPKKEQSRAESFTVADRIRCVIRSVEKTGKNAGVLVSRAAPELVMRLFEQEVPEIYDGTVVIKGCAREAGERTKIAVSSRDRDVDSVGACVGMKGMRVQSIIRELRGEKIDIIQFSDDPVVFATNALSPAKITRVAIVEGQEKHMEVIVDDSQLSLAIGKKGQNVRLGAKLLGWRIDIKSEEEKRQEVESEMAALVVPGAPVSVLMDHGLSDKLMEKLTEATVSTVEQLGQMTPEQLEEIPGIGPKMVEKIQAAVVAYYEQFEVAVEEGGAESEAPAETGDPGQVEEEAQAATEADVEEATASLPDAIPAAPATVP
ncbi:MAG: transcription termination/antitermination protein NusA, partial [bacterium]|nr:transcription termination/antitermination protein NusA [bacterium]